MLLKPARWLGRQYPPDLPLRVHYLERPHLGEPALSLEKVLVSVLVDPVANHVDKTHQQVASSFSDLESLVKESTAVRDEVSRRTWEKYVSVLPPLVDTFRALMFFNPCRKGKSSAASGEVDLRVRK